MRLLLAAILGLSALSTTAVLTGCGGASEANAAEAQAPRQLSFEIVNNSRSDIRNIGLHGANIPMSFSPIDKGATSSIKSKKLELPETLTLHWTDSRGERHEGSVRIWGELGASYTGPVILTINHRNKVSLSGG